MPISYTASTTLVATTATLSADTASAAYHTGSSALPGTGWTYASGSAPIPATNVAADWIAIEFYLGASIGLWVCTTGVMIGSLTTALSGQTVMAVTAGAANGTSCVLLPPGQSQPTVMGNLQPTPNWNAQNGVITYYSGTQSPPWNPTTTYALGNRVFYNGFIYSSIAGSNTNNQPTGAPVSNASWTWTPAVLGSQTADQSESVNFTAQSGFAGTHNAGHWPFGPNYVSICPTASCSGEVNIIFQ